MGSGGSFVAILLSVPLTAVALVGVVGVPKLQEMISSATSSPGDDDFDENGFTPRARSKRGSKSDRDKDEDAALWSDESNLEDEFSDDLGTKGKPSRSKSSPTRNSKSTSEEDPFGSDLKEEDDFFKKPTRSRLAQSAQREPESKEMFATEPFKPRPQVQQAEHVTPASMPARSDNFASAIEKLRSMGVDRFHLEPGLGAGQYLFVCQVAAAGESGTVHRFEAEAADPTSAVADVTKQLAEWQAESSVTKTAGTQFRR
jgi:hypothetical protein